MRKILLFTVIIITAACSTGEQYRIALVTGGHAYDSVNFVEVFQSYDNVSFDHFVQPEGNNLYSSDSIDKYDALVFYDLYQEISGDQKQAFLSMLNDGKGIVFLHHSIASYQDWDVFMNILGACYYLEPSVFKGDSVPASTFAEGEDVNVRVLDPEHPVVMGVKDFTIHDEVYDYVKIIPDIHPLLGTDHPNSMPYVAWTNEYGKSRIVYIQSGHDNNAYINPNFRRIIHQAIEWVADH